MRLVAFGCSLTYGQGLSDCYVAPNYAGQEPSKLSWPYIIASELGIECLNLSSPGSSNKKIWHTILNFEFRSDDIVFILWSYPLRSCIINRDQITDIGPWLENSNLLYDNFYSDYDAETMTKLFVKNSNDYLKRKNIKTHNLVVAELFKNIFTLTDQVTPHLKIFIDSFRHKFAVSLDNSHPDENCHKELARLILNEIDIKHSIPKQKQISIKEKFKFTYSRLYRLIKHGY
jgi:hypothetical protein